MSLRRAGIAATGLCAAPLPALAHASERMVILTLPTGHYIAGAALAVALTALVGALAPRMPGPRPRTLLTRRARAASHLASWAGCGIFWLLIAAGLFGSRDPLGNPLPLAVWIGLWVTLPLVTLVVGDVWRDIAPWKAPVRAARRLAGRRHGVGLARLGHWPAVAGFLAFAWFEIVSPAPADPAVLARAAAGYWLVVFALAFLEGEAWLDEGEAFHVFFALLARIAPFWSEPDGCGRFRLMAGLPGAQILAMPPLAPSAAAFLTLVLASVSFDGLSETFWWLARLGINPLEFPGRSAVIAANTAGLIAAWGLTAAILLATVALGRSLAGRTDPFARDAGRWMLSFLPISAGYHAAHYFVALLSTGQYAIAWLNDPFGRGRHLLGLPDHWVSFAFLTDAGTVSMIWNAQVAMILGAHLLAVVLGLRLVGGGGRRGALAHAPMTLVMVLYTAFGLWLLAAPTGT